jgi:Holliday junction resolvase-like predicted endonuclease
MTTLILLMGEQPAPNLLLIRHRRPAGVVLVHTTRTKPQTARLKRLLDIEAEELLVDPYRLNDVAADLRRGLDEHGWPAESLHFDLTGGTKPMSLAAYEVARQLGAAVSYLQSEGGANLLYHYAFDPAGDLQLAGLEELSESITLRDYLDLYLDAYRVGEPRHPLELLVAEALRAAGLEVFTSVYPQREGSVEIDLVLRRGNQVGIMEVKTTGDKAGVDQVVAVGGQRHLGTFVSRFLISTRPFHPNTEKIALAYRVHLIHLPGYTPDPPALTLADRQHLVDRVLMAMGGRAA